MVALDNSLLEWYNRLPLPLRETTTRGVSESIVSARTVMRWRYRLLRVVLHRPVLLNYAMRRIPFSQLRPDEQQAIEKCRTSARDLLSDIAANNLPNQMCAWHGLWFMYQTVMVPLLSIYTDPHEPSVVEPSSESIELSLRAMADMMHYSPTGKRSVDAASRIYEAAKRLVAETHSMMEDKKGAITRTSIKTKPARIKTDVPKQHNPSSAQDTPTDISMTYSPNGTTMTSFSNNQNNQNHPLHRTLSNHTSSSPDYYHTQTPPPGTYPQHQQHQPFHPYNPTNLPNGTSNPYTDLEMSAMWDSLNWSTGWPIDGTENLDFPIEPVGVPMHGGGNGTSALGWEHMGMFAGCQPGAAGTGPTSVRVNPEMEVQWGGVINDHGHRTDPTENSTQQVWQ